MTTTQYIPRPSYQVRISVTSGNWSDGTAGAADDPFARTDTEVVIDWWHALRQLLRRGKVIVHVTHNITGNRDAMLHVMNIRPVDVVAAPHGQSNGRPAERAQLGDDELVARGLKPSYVDGHTPVYRDEH